MNSGEMVMCEGVQEVVSMGKLIYHMMLFHENTLTPLIPLCCTKL